MTTKVISIGGYPVEVLTAEDAPGGKNVSSEDITDATETGRKLLKAEDAAAARDVIGAVTIGTEATDAKPGDYKPTSDEISDATDIGKQILTAKDAAAIKDLLGIT